MRAPLAEALSAREAQVLSAVSRGLANKQIARDLRLSEATVKTHLEHISAKLGVSDRTAAATLALQRGDPPVTPAKAVKVQGASPAGNRPELD